MADFRRYPYPLYPYPPFGRLTTGYLIQYSYTFYTVRIIYATVMGCIYAVAGSGYRRGTTVLSTTPYVL